METNRLKILAAMFVKESEIEGDAKLELMKFVRSEANDSQLMSLVLDGGIVTLSEQAQHVVADRFSVFEVDHAESIGEVFKQAEKDFWYGNLNRLFGQCAQKCGRIAISKEKRACKNACTAKRDSAIAQARAKLKTAKSAAKSKEREAKAKTGVDAVRASRTAAKLQKVKDVKAAKKVYKAGKY